MFGRKKKVEEPIENERTEIVEAKSATASKKAINEVKITLTPEQERIQANAESFAHNYNFAMFSESDFGMKAEPYICNLLFSIYSELRELRKDINEMKNQE